MAKKIMKNCPRCGARTGGQNCCPDGCEWEPWEGRPSRFTGDVLPCEVPVQEEDLEEDEEREEDEDNADEYGKLG